MSNRYDCTEIGCLDDEYGSKMPKLCWWSWACGEMPKLLMPEQGERLLMCSDS